MRLNVASKAFSAQLVRSAIVGSPGGIRGNTYETAYDVQLTGLIWPSG